MGSNRTEIAYTYIYILRIVRNYNREIPINRVAFGLCWTSDEITSVAENKNYKC